MKINFIDLKRQYNKYKTDIDREISEVLESTHFILGNKVSELENQLAAYAGVRSGLV